MRTRALALIALSVAWLVPAGASTCAPPASEAVVHAQSDRHDRHEHSHGHSHPGEVSHGHAAVPASQKSEPAAPLDAPTCCFDEARTPTVAASVPEANPRPKPIPLGPVSASLAAAQPVVRSAGARLRRSPPPLPPYAHTRRPLLI